jgi:hypothetical protein
VTLQLAPCPRCQAAVVYGERNCRHCGQDFDYGSAAVPIPDIHTIRAALMAYGLPAPEPPVLDLDAIMNAPPAAAPPVPTRPPEPVYDDGGLSSLVERTGHVDAGAVVDERIPDLIDSTLYRSMVPAVVPVEFVEGLESTHVEVTSDVAIDLETVSVLDTGRFDGSRDAAVVREDIPGFVDSTLYAAYAQGPVETEVVPDLEIMGAMRPKQVVAARKKDDPIPCSDCGTSFAGTRCPSCGARRGATL